LDSLEAIIDYNIRNGIRLFRISSDLIPFGSSPVNKLPWRDLFRTQFDLIGEKIKAGGVRVSMHPGQYTVLNSPDQTVREKAAEDLIYHANVLDALGVGPECKIVLHIGGVYGDKEKAMRRFADHYSKLDPAVKKRLVIENDDKSYAISDVLSLGRNLDIPVVYDNLHNRINPCSSFMGDGGWIEEAGKTWKEKDGRQKIHYAQQAKGKPPGSHSDTIETDEFLAFCSEIETKDVDVMLEVKDKNLSAVKCLNLTSEKRDIKALEQEWSRYKYAVLERYPNAYNGIRELLQDKSGYPATVFYWILEDTLKKKPDTGTAINAAQHVWGYFKDAATEREKRDYLKCVEDCRTGKASVARLKRLLWRLTEKYQEPYLMNSYYFILN
jgi:UV DNA damage endonuclease